MLLIGELSSLGAKYHSKKSEKISDSDKKYAYHVYMLKLYTEILQLTLDSDKLRKRYIK